MVYHFNTVTDKLYLSVLWVLDLSILYIWYITHSEKTFSSAELLKKLKYAS